MRGGLRRRRRPAARSAGRSRTPWTKFCRCFGLPGSSRRVRGKRRRAYRRGRRGRRVSRSTTRWCEQRVQVVLEEGSRSPDAVGISGKMKRSSPRRTRLRSADQDSRRRTVEVLERAVPAVNANNRKSKRERRCSWEVERIDVPFVLSYLP